jgi:hypothetical protein
MYDLKGRSAVSALVYASKVVLKVKAAAEVAGLAD